MDHNQRSSGPAGEERILALERPDKNLLVLYALMSLLTTIAAPFVFVPLFFKYHTLRYKLDREGISASWGILFKREVHLTYKRIQDIHVKRNFFERWLGIATIEVQTASGSSSSELSFEGIREFDALREFLYRRMRGHELVSEGSGLGAGARAVGASGAGADGGGSGTRSAGAAGQAAAGIGSSAATAAGNVGAADADSADAEVVALLRSIQAEIEATRRALEARS
jgi:putative membrane protein